MSLGRACVGKEDSLLEPPPAPKSKWDDTTRPAWMQERTRLGVSGLAGHGGGVEDGATGEEERSLEASRPCGQGGRSRRAIESHHGVAKSRGHKVIELPAHLIRVLIGKAGSTIREVISRTGADIKVNHLPHEPHGSTSEQKRS